MQVELSTLHMKASAEIISVELGKLVLHAPGD